MASLSATSLAVTLAHAVHYLTQCLVPSLPATTLSRLQTALEANLASSFASTWTPTEPLRGSGRRCLTFGPGMLPPRPVYNACVAAGVEWEQWSNRLLGTTEFDMFIDPGCVSVRIGGAAARSGSTSSLVTIWSAEIELGLELEAEAKAQALVEEQLRAAQRQLEAKRAQLRHLKLNHHAQHTLFAPAPQPVDKVQGGKTLAQRLMEADSADDDALFSLLAEELRAPTWMTPIIEQFPGVPGTIGEPTESTQSTRPALHSRSSSRSSCSTFSFLSDDSVTSCASLSSVSSVQDPDHSSRAGSRQSRRDRARQVRVFVDTSKNEVTPYDGGKTTVLTGGVMLGAPAKTSATTGAWRPRRF